MKLLESWAMARLEALGVDGVFAPYIVGMLPSHGGSDDNLEDAKCSIHQVLMGWLAPEDEERAYDFVDELAKLSDNPAQLTDAAMALSHGDKRIEDDINKMLAQDAELKASAPTFVPRKLSSSVVTALYPTGSPEMLGKSFDQPYSATSPPPASLSINEDSFFWSVAYELVSHMQLKFPDIDPNRLCDLLRLVGLDVDKAHAVMKATIERESIGPGQVCRHYLQGECRRADCMFLHDTDKITCRFWLRGTCLQAEHCVFAHDFCEYYSMDGDALGQRDYDSEDEMDQNSELLDIQAEEMFPALQSVTSATSTSVPLLRQGNDCLSLTKTNSYPSTENVVANLTMNFARAVALQPAPTKFSGRLHDGGSDMQSSRRVPQSPPIYRSLYHKAGKNDVKWVTTGESVSSQYLELREQAHEMACARNKCFMGATQAYRNGNKALAKDLSRQGHEYNVKMKNFHFLAASEIFESRNPPNQLYMDRMMDLHGLHVAETVELLTQMLPKLADEGVDSIHLVTGSGHHSKGSNGNARLLPAVKQFLGAEGYQYTHVADGAGFVGMLLVDLRW
ncbi:hypothetical protein F443_09528 [Plasmopara halstedii]|uniref:Smr domain-containing protein n=1 Tax=Plasmopara halstedii TaxID=4781 RepID=A0A0P1AEJ2_PLAHL|nr:hypothetical protein F443_09528 [Plasmopara halstedii]CEG39394.1 hypothetical protein F443_09528 [Plasmopara halstedii]|eukprot:XP_024575763.1 hypothetical protein F443_09528 [Plasmopara halstedii]